MTNKSGKFRSPVSHIETETSVTELSQKIPPAPHTFLQSVECYFGKYWWLWIILLLIIKINSK